MGGQREAWKLCGRLQQSGGWPDIQSMVFGQRAWLAPEDEPGADTSPAHLPHPLTRSMPPDWGFHLRETPASNWARRSS